MEINKILKVMGIFVKIHFSSFPASRSKEHQNLPCCAQFISAYYCKEKKNCNISSICNNILNITLKWLSFFINISNLSPIQYAMPNFHNSVMKIMFHPTCYLVIGHMSDCCNKLVSDSVLHILEYFKLELLFPCAIYIKWFF